MARISIKKNFLDNEKLFAQQLNNNFETIEKAVNDGNKIVWQDGVEVKFKRLFTKDINSLPIQDGAVIYDIENGGHYIDYKGNRIVAGSAAKEIVVSPTEPTTGEQIWVQKGKNLFNPEIVCVGYINNDTGTLNSNSSNSLSTDFIKVSGSKNYYLGYYKQGGSWGAWYDKDKNYISGISIGSYTGEIVKAPENAKYLRFTVSYNNNNPNYANNTFIVQSDIEVSYEPYIDKKIFVKNDNGVYEEFYDESNLEVYSLGEQRIGTWMGKSLYRKVIEFTMALEEGENNVPHGVIGLDKVIRKDIVNNSSSMFPYLDTNETASIFKVSSTDVTIKCIGGSWGSTTRQIILEYTKTTD